MADTIPSLSMLPATAIPWITALPSLNLSNISIATTSTPTPSLSTPTPTSPICQYAPPPHATPAFPSISPPIQNTNGDCLPQPPAYGPHPSHDTLHAFHTSPSFRGSALSALTPYTYTLAFQDLNASYVGSTYLGHYELDTYSTSECAQRCNYWGVEIDKTTPHEPSALSTVPFDQAGATLVPAPPPQMCQGFNIYFERSPAIHLGSKCRDAESRTIIKCALWGEGVTEEGATNTGYMEWEFDVGIAGSNGYRLGKDGKAWNAGETKRVALGGGLMVVSMAVMVGWLVAGGT